MTREADDIIQILHTVVNEGRDYHSEFMALMAQLDAMRKQAGAPRILHCYTRYIMGKILNTETGEVRFVLCPPRNSSDWDALVDMPWNKNARGGRHE